MSTLRKVLMYQMAVLVLLMAAPVAMVWTLFTVCKIIWLFLDDEFGKLAAQFYLEREKK